MKTMMNCDDAFDTLTSGPVELSASTSRELVEHLEECASCRELAEALRPATHLLHEALPCHHDLPQVLAEDDEVVLRIMRQVHTTTRPPAQGYWRATTAAGLATVACALLVFMAPWWSSGHGGAGRDLREQLADFGAPRVCFQTISNHDVTSHLSSTNCNDCHIDKEADQLGAHCSLTIACCTTCHAATAPTAPRVPAQQLLAACGSCHVTAR